MSEATSTTGPKAVTHQANSHVAEDGKPSVTSKIKIRYAEAVDKEPARRLLNQFHGDTIFSHLPFSDKKFERYAETILSKPAHTVCFVAEFEGELVGLIWATAGTYVLSDEGIVTTVHILAIDIERLSEIWRVKALGALLRAVKNCSISQNSIGLLVHVTTGINTMSADHLFKAFGAKIIGGNYLFYENF